MQCIRTVHYTGVEICDLKNIWNLIEDYFLGKLPKVLSNSLEDKTEANIIYEGGSHKNESYSEIFDYLNNELTDITQNDQEVFEKIIEDSQINRVQKPYTFTELSLDTDNGNVKISPDLCWSKTKVLLFLNYNKDEYEKSKDINWHTFYVDKNFDYNKFADALKGNL